LGMGRLLHFYSGVIYPYAINLRSRRKKANDKSAQNGDGAQDVEI
jgi:hypothetical protein